jgi:hypothetical protein
MSYRDDLVSDDKWTEKLANWLETVTFGAADYFSGGAVSGGAAGVELFVAWHEANMADFAERRLGTADPGTGAAAWREFGEAATDEAIEVVAGQLLHGLPTPEQSPEYVDLVLDDVKQRAADKIGDVGSASVGGGVSGMAGETNVSP